MMQLIFAVTSRTSFASCANMFAGINMFWARLRLILARAKISLRRAQNIFMPKNINSITINITLEGIEKIKT